MPQVFDVVAVTMTAYSFHSHGDSPLSVFLRYPLGKGEPGDVILFDGDLDVGLILGPLGDHLHGGASGAEGGGTATVCDAIHHGIVDTA